VIVLYEYIIPAVNASNAPQIIQHNPNIHNLESSNSIKFLLSKMLEWIPSTTFPFQQWAVTVCFIRHMNVIASHVLFSPLKRTKYHSSTPGIERLIF